MSRLLIVAFQPDDAVALAGFAASLGLPYDVLNFNGSPQLTNGAEKTLVASLSEGLPADASAQVISSLANGYTHVAAVSSMHSKDTFGRVAGKLDWAAVTDVTGVNSPNSFQRTMVAGSVVATVEVLQGPVLLTVRPGGFPAPASLSTSQSEAVSVETNSKVKIVSAAAKKGGRPDLTQAKRIISGGRPLKDAATFEQVIGGFADKLGGAAGATRAAVDSGIASNDLQVGQTGKIVAPDLYIAAGISGSTQHMAGIKDSKVIVAINKDSGAPIFEFADFGLVADLYTAIPELMAKL